MVDRIAFVDGRQSDTFIRVERSGSNREGEPIVRISLVREDKVVHAEFDYDDLVMGLGRACGVKGV